MSTTTARPSPLLTALDHAMIERADLDLPDGSVRWRRWRGISVAALTDASRLEVRQLAADAFHWKHHHPREATMIGSEGLCASEVLARDAALDAAAWGAVPLVQSGRYRLHGYRVNQPGILDVTLADGRTAVKLSAARNAAIEPQHRSRSGWYDDERGRAVVEAAFPLPAGRHDVALGVLAAE